jgi:hypothetical protein
MHISLSQSLIQSLFFLFSLLPQPCVRLVLLLRVLIVNQVNLRTLYIKQIVATHVFLVDIKRVRGKQVVLYVVQLRVPIRPKNIKTKQDKPVAKIAMI